MTEPRWVSDTEQQFITVKEAATYLGCSIDLIYDAIRCGPPDGIATKQKGWKGWHRIPKNEFLKWAHDYTKKEII